MLVIIHIVVSMKYLFFLYLLCIDFDEKGAYIFVKDSYIHVKIWRQI